jgi:hypothetical protein
MDAHATLVWMAPEPPDREQSRALSSWSNAHAIQVAPPSSEIAPALATDPAASEFVESMLERARDAIAARESGDAERAIASAESVLRAHPELPQAAWLMAEVERAKAARWRRLPPADVEAATSAWLRAEALDGGRVPGIGEESSSQHPSPATVVLELSSDQTQPWLDGRLVSSGSLAMRAGPHALLITWDGTPVWSAWIEAPPGRSTMRVSIPEAPACSAGDVSSARVIGEAVEARRVQCPAWIAATGAAQPGSLRLAMCSADRCGPLLMWRPPAPWLWSPTVQHDRGIRWPTWATWSLVGAGAAIAAGVVILAATRSTPSETRFVNGGLKTQ